MVQAVDLWPQDRRDGVSVQRRGWKNDWVACAAVSSQKLRHIAASGTAGARYGRSGRGAGVTCAVSVDGLHIAGADGVSKSDFSGTSVLALIGAA